MARPQNNNLLPPPNQKHVYVQEMFDAIAPRYDLLNTVLSASLHHFWRKQTVRRLGIKQGDTCLDICTGTGDLAFEMGHVCGPTGTVHASDFSDGMLAIARTKNATRGAANITFAKADAQALPYESNVYDASTVAFGMRNVANLDAGIAELIRVTKPSGRVAILEFNQPTSAWFRGVYRFYTFKILPLIGGIISGRKSAYTYLPASVDAWPCREELTRRLTDAGCASVSCVDFMLGAVALHVGVKNER